MRATKNISFVSQIANCISAIPNKFGCVRFTRLFILATTTLLTSCATIVSGGSPKIFLEGNVTEPLTITTTKETYHNVILPYVVRVKRHKLDGQVIHVQSATAKYKDIYLGKTVNGWTFGNILLGGIIGWSVDLATNNVSKPSQSHFFISSNDTITYHK